MNKEILAGLLNGNSYGDEISSEQERQAKEAGLVVIYGASDDLMEFRGAINEELSAGEAVIVRKDGDLTAMTREEFDEELEVVRKYGAIPVTFPVTAEWCPDDPECSWLIKTELPHATFDVMEDGELYCRGIVIDVNYFKTK